MHRLLIELNPFNSFQGCDASILLNSTAKNLSEKEAFQSMTLAAFDVIDDIKEHLEAVCPSTVSCADIVALAGAESIFQVRKFPPYFSSQREDHVPTKQEAQQTCGSLLCQHRSFNGR
jgi:peroxidase